MPVMRQQTGASERRQYSDRQEQVSTSNTTGRSRLAPAIEQQAGADQRQQYNNHQEQVCCADRLPSGEKKSAQPDATNTAAYRHLPIHYPIPQRRTATCPERGSARGKSGLRNSERLSPRKLAHAKVSPRKGNPTAKVSPLERKSPPSDARHCTISGTIFSLFLSIIQLHVYYKEHTSKLLTLNSESVILWSS